VSDNCIWMKAASCQCHYSHSHWYNSIIKHTNITSSCTNFNCWHQPTHRTGLSAIQNAENRSRIIQITLEMRQSSNSTTFKLWTFSTNLTFDKCFKHFSRMRIHGKILVLRQISYAQRARELIFSDSTYHTNYNYWMCNIIITQWCVTLY